MRRGDRVAIVTGAGQGIGFAIAQRLSREGTRVVLGDVDAAAVRRSARQIAREGGRAIAVHVDVRRCGSVVRFVNRAEARCGRVDILVNNAAVQPVHDFFQVTERAWDEVLDVNLRGPFLLSQEVARRWVAAKRRGVIINLASTNSVVARADMVPYAASKGGIAMLTRAMAVALAPHGIRAVAVAPGTIDTPNTRPALRDAARRRRILARTPIGRIGTPADIAGVVAFLASDDASYMTGTTVFVDGGRLALGHVDARLPVSPR
jgi:glucose 1-dehydrogenase